MPMDSPTKNRLLVVDDEDLLRSSLVKLLAMEGYSVLSASDGNEALMLIKENKFQLIITDLKMPGMSGMELIEEVRKLSPDTKVVILTAHGEWNTYLEALEKEVFEYLNKPINKDDLFYAVKRALSGPSIAEK
jgi:DNA-binding NtrC family response regulator